MEARIDSRRESEHFMPAGASAWQKKHPYEPSPKSRPQPIPLVSPADLVNPMLTAGDIAEKGMAVCDPKLPLLEAIAMVAQAESGLLPVVSRGKPVGILTEREVVRAVARSPSGFLRQTVEQVMSREFSLVADKESLDALFERFGNRGVLVVDRGGRLQGVIHWKNLCDHLSERGLGKVLVNLMRRGPGRPSRRA